MREEGGKGGPTITCGKNEMIIIVDIGNQLDCVLEKNTVASLLIFKWLEIIASTNKSMK